MQEKGGKKQRKIPKKPFETAKTPLAPGRKPWYHL
jgi:hypothetical protein